MLTHLESAVLTQLSLDLRAAPRSVPAGSGKTTLLSQLSLDLCLQGVKTLWGSFEVKHTRLVSAMLTQLVGGRLNCADGTLAAAGTRPAERESVLQDQLRDHFEFAASGLAAPWQVAAVGHEPAAADVLKQYERAADMLADLPMTFLRFHGSTDVDRVLDALEYAVRAIRFKPLCLNSQHIVTCSGGLVTILHAL